MDRLIASEARLAQIWERRGIAARRGHFGPNRLEDKDMRIVCDSRERNTRLGENLRVGLGN
jgi:hypothetical protein